MLSTISEDLDLEAANGIVDYPMLWLALAALHVAGIQAGEMEVPAGAEEGAFTSSHAWASALLDDQKAANGEVLETLCSHCGWSTGKLSKWRCEECHPTH